MLKTIRQFIAETEKEVSVLNKLILEKTRMWQHNDGEIQNWVGQKYTCQLLIQRLERDFPANLLDPVIIDEVLKLEKESPNKQTNNLKKDKVK